MVFTARTFKRRLTKKKSRKSRKRSSSSRRRIRKQLGGNVLDSRLQEQYPDDAVIADAMEVEDAPGA